ncbi:MAG: DNA-binding protein [Nitrospinota bacterium]
MVKKWIILSAFTLALFANNSVEAASDMTGKVVTTMNSGGYTYVEFQQNDGSRVWAAAPVTKVGVGDTVSIPAASAPMRNFQSKSLNRVFESIFFVGALNVSGSTGGGSAAGKMPPGHPPTGAVAKGADVNFGPIQKPKGGHTIEELYKNASTLTGKSIIVKGKVVKSTQGIMGKNWVHIKDGTGKDGEDDLTLTTQQVLKVGDIVTAKGTYASDKNFGGGYVYKVIIENTSFEVDK